MSNHLPVGPDGAGAGEPMRVEPGAPAPYRALADDFAPPAEQRLPIRRMASAIWRFKWLVLLIVLVGTSAGFLVSRVFLQPKYTVHSTLWLEVTPDRHAAQQGPLQAGQLLTSFAWLDLLRSYVVFEHVVRELRLYVQPKVVADSSLLATLTVNEQLRPGTYHFAADASGRGFTLSDGEGTVLQRGQAGEVVGQSAGFHWVPPAEAFVPGRRVEFTVRRPLEVARELGTRLSSRMPDRGRGNFISLQLTGDQPERLAATLNGITSRFVEVAAELKRAQSEELAMILREQLDAAATNLHEAESSLQGFRVSTATLPTAEVMAAPGVETTTGVAFTGYFGMRVEKEQIRRDRQALQRAVAQAGRSEISIPALEVIPSVRASTELNGALAELTTKRAARRALLNQFTEAYPEVQQLSNEIRTLEDQVIPALARNLLSELAAREADIDGRIQIASGEMRAIPARSIEEARLHRSVAIADQLYTTLRQRYETARLAAISTVPDVRVLDHASVPSEPVNDQQRQRVFLMFLLGSLGLALATPILLDRVDPRLRYPEQVTNEMGLPILGAIPHVVAANGDGGGRQLGRESTSNAVEAFREIRLSVSNAYGAAGPLLATVTSPGVGDGKSFIASNLALAYADLGHRVLLIDGDIRRGQMHHLMGAVRVPGLTDYLAGAANADEIVQQTGFASLDLIAAGTRMQAGPELLASAAMAELIRRLRARYTVILVDSPPLGAGVDPFILSTLTGNTLLVMRNGRTDREFARAKLDMLDRLPVRLLGVILNDVAAGAAYRYYGYLPGYGVEEAERSEEEETTEVGQA